MGLGKQGLRTRRSRPRHARGLRQVHAGTVEDSAIPRRKLGRTGYEATIVSLGGWPPPLRQADRREEAIEIIRRALDLGLNYIDTAETYGDGASERHIGEAVGGRRKGVFVATKTEQRRAQPIRARLFEESCQRLQTEFVDLYLLHGVSNREDLATVLDRDGGAITAFEHYRDAGRTRHLGVSSHSNETLIEAMDAYEFDCVFVTLNAAGMRMNDPNNTEAMLAKAAEKGVGVIAMKIFGGPGAQILDSGITIEQALRYTLSFPVCTANIGISAVDQLDENVRWAKAFVPYTEDERAELARLVKA